MKEEVSGGGSERLDKDYVRSIPGTILFVVLALGHLALALYYFSLLGIKLLETGAGTPDDWRDHASLFCIQAGLLEFLLGALTIMGVLPSVRSESYRVLGPLRLVTALHLVPLVPMALAGLTLIILTLLAWPLIVVEGGGVMATFFRPITSRTKGGEAKAADERSHSEPAPEPGSESKSEPVLPLTSITVEEELDRGGEAIEEEGQAGLPPLLLNAHHYVPTPFLPLGPANGATSMMRRHSAANSKE